MGTQKNTSAGRRSITSAVFAIALSAPVLAQGQASQDDRTSLDDPAMFAESAATPVPDTELAPTDTDLSSDLAPADAGPDAEAALLEFFAADPVVAPQAERTEANAAEPPTVETIPVESLGATDAQRLEAMPEKRVRDEGIETMVVTARKREELLSDVPESIQAFGGDTLEAAGVNSVKDLSKLTPNFAVIEAQQPGVVLINVRGIGQIRMGEAPIAVVVDGVQSNIPNQITQDLFDIERIEILKGPQGSIYGRNAIGGAINIVTTPPSNEFTGRIVGTLGNGEDRRVGVQLSGPVIEDLLSFRIAGKYREFGGLIEGVNIGEMVDHEEAKTGRVNLLFTPSDVFSMSLTASFDDIEAGAAYYVPYSTLRGLGRAGRDPKEISRPRPVVLDHKGFATRRIEDISLKIDYETPFGLLSSVTAYSTLESYLDEELDYTRLPLLTAIQTVDNEAFSQELRLTSTGDGALDWLVGAYYLAVDRETLTQPYILEDVTDLLGLPFSIPFIRKHFTDDNQSYAVFAHMGYPFGRGFEISGGFRYDIDEREQLSLIDNSVGEATFRSLQPKLSLSYKFDTADSDLFEDFMLYSSVGKGFRSGGFNPSDKVGRQFNKEETISYELGFKSRLPSSTFLNVAAFYTDITDRQVYTLDLLTVSQLIANPIPESHVMGIELELSTRPFRGLAIGGGLGLLKSKIDSYDPSIYADTVARGDFTGNDLNQVPGFSYTAFFEYTLPIGPLSLITRGDFNGSGGDYYWEINNNDRREPQNFANFRMTLKGDHWSLSGFVDNAFDEAFVAEYVPYEFSGGLSDLGLPGRPRRYGVELGFNF